jgi:glycolate oxidase FAD binding subunit
MDAVASPRSEAELAALIEGAGGPLEVIGLGTKRRLGRPVAAEAALDLSRLSGIRMYEPEELVLEAAAGTPVAEIEAVLAAENQQLAFEPPNLATLLHSRHAGSLGGVVACNLSGPRRIRAGAARDHVLGLRAVTGRGDVVKAGGRVMKNVTGYDLPKLLAGSMGTLAALTAITLKVLPRPETEATVVREGLGDNEAVRAMALAMQSPCDVSGAAHLPGSPPQTLLRIEGFAPSVAYRCDRLRSLLGGETSLLAAEESARRWQAVRDVPRFADNPARLVWKLSVAPSEAPAIVARIAEKIDARHFYDWAGGLVWLDIPFTEDAGAPVVRDALAGGHATLFRAPEPLRAAVEVFQPQPPALAALSARVKESFDPHHLLNPGRMYREV